VWNEKNVVDKIGFLECEESGRARTVARRREGWVRKFVGSGTESGGTAPRRMRRIEVGSEERWGPIPRIPCGLQKAIGGGGRAIKD